MWGCFLMSGVKILHFLKDWWKSIPIHQNYTMALKYRFYSNVLMLFHPSYMYSADGIKNRRNKILWFYKMHLCMHKI